MRTFCIFLIFPTSITHRVRSFKRSRSFPSISSMRLRQSSILIGHLSASPQKRQLFLPCRACPYVVQLPSRWSFLRLHHPLPATPPEHVPDVKCRIRRQSASPCNAAA